MTIKELADRLNKEVQRHYGDKEVCFEGKEGEPIVHSWHTANGKYYLIGASVIEMYAKMEMDEEY